MAIPKYNELYRLVLLSLQDGGTHSMKMKFEILSFRLCI